MKQGARYGPPIERHPDGTLYQMSPGQLKQAAKLIKKHCCNCDKGNCILLDDGDGWVCPQRLSFSACSRWFRNAVLPAFPEPEAGIFKIDGAGSQGKGESKIHTMWQLSQKYAQVLSGKEAVYAEYWEARK